MKKVALVIIAASIANVALALPIKPIVATATITKNSYSHAANEQAEKKTVYLLPITLNQQQLKELVKRLQSVNVESSLSTLLSDLPDHYEVGMNNVPVLDQGKHGSCVTFATTAAIDALLGKGDYISQLCNLELGSYLEQYGPLDPSGHGEKTGYPSGWYGSTSALVIDQIRNFGLISKDKQSQGLCAGIKDYPLHDADNQGRPMTLETFSQNSEPLVYLTADNHLQIFHYQEFMPTDQWNDKPIDRQIFLQKLKQLLFQKIANTKSRVVFSVLLPYTHCSVGACVSFHKSDDTWALTNEIKNDHNVFNLAGHEMVITSYDDNAVAIDRDGNQHKGLITLRNSWGDNVGDSGNYYMTYDFFKVFAMDMTQVFIKNM